MFREYVILFISGLLGQAMQLAYHAQKQESIYRAAGTVFDYKKFFKGERLGIFISFLALVGVLFLWGEWMGAVKSFNGRFSSLAIYQRTFFLLWGAVGGSLSQEVFGKTEKYGKGIIRSLRPIEGVEEEPVKEEKENPPVI